MNQTVDDRRSDLDAAIAQHEGTTAAEPVKPDTLPPEQLVAERPQDSEPVEPAQEAAEPQHQQDNTQIDTPPAEAAKVDAPPKKKAPSAPIDWSAEEKEAYATLPDVAKTAIHRREAHINQVLQDTAEARRLNEQIARTIEPYRALMAAEGIQNPLQAIDGMFKTVAQLHTGTPAQKAQRLALLAKHYAIDIELLDKALVGTLPENPEQDKVEQIVNQRLAPFYQWQQQQQQQEQQYHQQIYQGAVQTIEQMAENPQFPHFASVRLEMANFMEAAAREQKPLTIEEAYDKACWAEPAIRTQLMSTQNVRQIQDKRNAASSISGQRSGGAGTNNALQDMDIRAMLEAQIPGSNRL